MWQVLILVCGLSGPCDRDTARLTVLVPEPAPALAMCGMVGQAYIAQTELVHDDERVKVLCTTSGRGNAA